MVRNRYLRIERGRELTEQGKSKNRCGQCGQLKRGHVCQAPRALVSTSYQAQEAQHEVHRLRVGDPFGAGINIGSAGGLNIGSGGGLNMVAIGQHVAPNDPTYGVPTLMVTAAPQAHHWGIGGVVPSNANPASAAPAAAPDSAAFGPPMLRPQESMDLLAFVAEHATQPAQKTEVPSIDDDELPSMGLSGELPPAPAAPAPAGGGHFGSAATAGGISLSFGGGGVGFGGMGGGLGGMGMNPAMLAQAQQMMANNPAMAAQAQQMMNNPQMMAQAQQMMNDPQAMQQIMQMMNRGGTDMGGGFRGGFGGGGFGGF